VALATCAIDALVMVCRRRRRAAASDAE